MIRVAAPIGLNSSIASVLVALVVFTPNRVTSADAADGPALMQKVRDDIAWIGKLKSFHLLARIEDRRTPEGIEHDLRKIKNQFPELDKPDALVFTELLPAINVRLELDFDTRRLRKCELSRDDLSRELSRDVRVWDGRRTIHHEQRFHPVSDRILLRPNITFASDYFWGWYSYLNQQPLVCWWDDNPERRELLRNVFGEAADFVWVDRTDYHGVDCHVLLEARNSYVNRYFVGVRDGRCYGFKKGTASFVNVPKGVETHQRLIEECLGRSLGTNPSDELWKAAYQELEALPAARRAELGKRYYSAVGTQLTPVWEVWFSDFHDLGEGRLLPFRETFLFYDSDEANKKIFVSNQRTVFVRNVTLNQPLDDSLFEETIAEGAEVVDETNKAK